MTGAAVDAEARLVRLGERSWPFALDLRDGRALLSLSTGPVRLRPLAWGEKVRLARFARADGVVAEQFLLLSASTGLEDADDDEREAAAALAGWLNAPAGGTSELGLPLDTSLLAVVTLEVCRAMGLAPGDLDGRDAAEVEALWHAAGTAEALATTAPAAFGGVAPAPAPATTRILVVPDPPEPGSPGAPDEPAACAPPEEDARAPGDAAAGRPQDDLEGTPATAAAEHPPAAAGPNGVPRLDRRAAARPARGRPAAAAVAHSSIPGAPPPAPSVHGTIADAPGSPAPVAAPWAARATPVSSAPLAGWSGVPDGGVQTGQRSEDAEPTTRPAPVSDSPVVDPEALLDVLAERLERAAAELGIDPGS